MSSVTPSILRIIRWIVGNGWLLDSQELPSAHHMAEEFGVSLRQVLRACHHLQELGLLHVLPGSGIFAGRDRPPSQSHTNTPRRAQEIVEERLIQAISSGSFRSGDELPKAAWLCHEWHISTAVLTRACHQLALKKLLHKRGKTWIIGAKTTEIADTISRHAIVLVCNKPDEWARFHENLLAGFALSLAAEADRCNVRLVPVLTGIENNSRDFPSGKNAIRQCVQNLGDKFRGFILFPLLEELPEFTSWCKWLAAFSKPVIWLQDYHPTFSIPPLPKLYRVQYGAWAGDRVATEVDLALVALQQYGHKHVVFLCNDPEIYHWFRLRAREMQEKAPPLGIHIQILESDVTDESIIQEALVQPQRATALIAPNDKYAKRYWRTLIDLGYSIPNDISMVSFDNLASLRPYPISTVDFGMTMLGYQVFHLLLGDIPIKVWPGNRLLGISRLIDNGSIATAQSARTPAKGSR